eukprot:CAMPEP_0170504494 /NCGR_PEP_ID=MMETSP0208-20121228/48091_1 /TAXON_ID=197538 /ORGANISM="Strombidium inclinatum, Strain S3" /LENGTH=47 /DNA_ID= /DNA_START= /DNA_END= /DNA_ORIENTATION=
MDQAGTEADCSCEDEPRAVLILAEGHLPPEVFDEVASSVHQERKDLV